MTAYVYLRNPRVTVADPTERLIETLRDFVQHKAQSFWSGFKTASSILKQSFRCKPSCERKIFPSRY